MDAPLIGASPSWLILFKQQKPDLSTEIYHPNPDLEIVIARGPKQSRLFK